jgi:GT2 family glycosyltransferase
MHPSLDIIIVNWNAGRQLHDCLTSLGAVDRRGFTLSRVVVVDNASTDGSPDGLAEGNLPRTVIRNGENRGFAAACNQGAAGSEADYLLFLNPDTRVLPPSLARPLHFLQQSENGEVGICGIQLVDEAGQVSRTCARFPKPGHFVVKMLGLDYLLPRFFQSHLLLDWDHADSRAVDHVIGAFFLVRRCVFEALGGFDERFFVYLEDLDFSFRARKAGWRSFYLADAQAYHKGGGTSEQVKATRLFYALRSRVLYGYKHFGFAAATLLALGTLVVEPLARLMRAAIHRSGREALETVHGVARLWGSLPELTRRRSEAQV